MSPVQKSLSERIKPVSKTKKKIEGAVFMLGELKSDWKEVHYVRIGKKNYIKTFLSHSMITKFIMGKLFAVSVDSNEKWICVFICLLELDRYKT